MKKVIAITGGIGAGKSVVSEILRIMGYPVYDCDSRAKLLMDNSKEIRQRIADDISPKALNPDFSLNRQALSKIVFHQPQKLLKLNEIVHGAVCQDFTTWAKAQANENVFVETAILYESGFDKFVNEVWEISAPENLRITRVMRRSGLNEEEIRRRINAQSTSNNPNHRIIVNDDTQPLLPQIFSLLS